MCLLSSLRKRAFELWMNSSKFLTFGWILQIFQPLDGFFKFSKPLYRKTLAYPLKVKMGFDMGFGTSNGPYLGSLWLISHLLWFWLSLRSLSELGQSLTWNSPQSLTGSWLESHLTFDLWVGLGFDLWLGVSLGFGLWLRSRFRLWPLTLTLTWPRPRLDLEVFRTLGRDFTW